MRKTAALISKQFTDRIFRFTRYAVHRLDIAMNYIIEHGLQVKKGLYGLLDYLKSKNTKSRLRLLPNAQEPTHI